MAVVNEARAILTAEDRASAVLAMVARNFDKLDRAATKLSHVQGDPRRQQVVNNAMERQAVLASRMGAVAARAAGPLAAMFGTYQAAQFVTNANKAFAENERAMTRIAVTADASGEAQSTAWRDLQKLAMETAQPVDKVREGLDALVAAGRSLPDAMAFLPAVARTAQASGAQVADIAKSADAIGSAFKIAGADMQGAFDIMATGGKLGQFELKDMARYLPSLAPAAAAIGMEGKKGLTDLVAMLQVLRKGSGTSEEAAGSMNNILQKMSSEETTKRFKKMGVDLEAMFKAGKAAGKDMISIFMEATQAATKGDLGKLPNLINDMEFSRGVRAMMMYRSELERMRQAIATTASGTVAQDLNRVLSNNQATMDRFKIATDRLADSLGKRLAPAFQTVTGAATAAIDAVAGALQPGEDEVAFRKRMNIPLTPQQQAAEYERMRRDRMAALDNPSSEYYSMRDGGFAPGTSRFSPQRYHILRNKRKLSKAEQQELANLERRYQKEREAREAAGRTPDAASTSWRMADRIAPQDYDGSTDDDRIRADTLRRQNEAREDRRTGEDALAGRGEAGVRLAIALEKVARAERRTLLNGGRPYPGDTSKQELAAAVEAILPKGPNGRPELAELERVYGQLTSGAKALAAQPSKSPTGEYLDVSGLGRLIASAIQGTKTDLNVNSTSEITVKVDAAPELKALITSKQTSTTVNDTRGVSLPGKETGWGGGGGGFSP